MADPTRLEVPADPRWLGVIDVVVRTTPRFVHDEGALDDLAIAVGEVAAEVGSSAGVATLEVTVDDVRITVTGHGSGVVWDPGPVWDRLVTRLAEVAWEADPSTVRIRLAPRPA